MDSKDKKAVQIPSSDMKSCTKSHLHVPNLILRLEKWSRWQKTHGNINSHTQNRTTGSNSSLEFGDNELEKSSYISEAKILLNYIASQKFKCDDFAKILQSFKKTPPNHTVSLHMISILMFESIFTTLNQELNFENLEENIYDLEILRIQRDCYHLMIQFEQIVDSLFGSYSSSYDVNDSEIKKRIYSLDQQIDDLLKQFYVKKGLFLS